MLKSFEIFTWISDIYVQNFNLVRLVKVAETQFLSLLSGTVTTLRSFLTMVWFSISTYFLIHLKWSVLIVTNLDVYSAVLFLWFFKWQCLWLWHDNVNLLYDFVPNGGLFLLPSGYTLLTNNIGNWFNCFFSFSTHFC